MGTRCSRALTSTTASRCSAARSTTPPARRSTRARGCSASATPAAPRSSASQLDGDPQAFRFPGSPGERARGGSHRKDFADSLDFSFAGVKTALLYATRELGESQTRERAADLAASYQAAIVERLVSRSERALSRTGLARLAVGGGVAANGELRRRLGELPAEVHVPARALCTDNAAMIASAARFGTRLPYPDYLGLDAYATGERAR